MSILDVILSVCIVASAVAFLAWQLLRGRRTPACHTIAGPVSSVKGPDVDVIVGGALARGLSAARARRAAATTSAR